MNTITAQTVDADPIPVVQIDVTMDAPAPVIGWNITRVVPGESVVIWIGAAGQSAMSVFDHTAPIGQPVTYTLTVVTDTSTDYVTSAPVTLAGTIGCFLTNPITGKTLPVELATWPARSWESRSTVLEVLARPDPIGLTDAHTTPAGTWTLITRTDAARVELVEMLVTGAIATLRTQPGSSITPCTVLVGTVVENRYSGAGGDQRRLIGVGIQEIAPLPATALPIAATLGGLAVFDGDTLALLAQQRTTLLGLSQIPVG